MTERMRESLSALMDDAADDLELARVLRAMEDDEEVSATWARYHLVSSVLRGGDPAMAAVTETVAIDLEEAGDGALGPLLDEDVAEEQADDAARGGATGWRPGPWTSFATAAAVTLAVVVGFQWQTVDSESPQVAAGVNAAGPVRTDLRALLNASGGTAARIEGPARLRIPSRFASDAMPEAGLQVDAYMLDHAEFSAVNSASGMVPFTRFVSFEGGRGEGGLRAP